MKNMHEVSATKEIGAYFPSPQIQIRFAHQTIRHCRYVNQGKIVVPMKHQYSNTHKLVIVIHIPASSVSDTFYFDTDPDPDPRIRFR